MRDEMNASSHAWLRRSGGVVMAIAASLSGCGSEETPVRGLGSEGFLAVPGANLRYATRGGGPPVIFVHGGPGIGATYFLASPPVPGFPPLGYRWVVYDQRGSGRSTGAEHPDSLNFDRFVRDLEEVRAATGRDRVFLMGHSFGGLVALRYAVAYPSRVAGLILLDPDPASRDLWMRHAGIIEGRTTDEDRAVMASASGAPGWETDPRALEIYSVARMQSYFGNRKAGRALMLGLEHDVYGNYPATATAVRESLGDWDFFGSLDMVAAPTLILTGDRSIFPKEAHERLRDALPSARLVVLPGVGHFPFIEDPGGFARTVNEFLSVATRARQGP